MNAKVVYAEGPMDAHVIYARWSKEFFAEDPKRLDIIVKGDVGLVDDYELMCSMPVNGIPVANDEEIADIMFAKFNNGEASRRRIRSMSMGDMVMIDDRLYVAKMVGWKRVDHAFAQALKDKLMTSGGSANAKANNSTAS